MKKLLAFVFAAMALFVFAGCGGEKITADNIPPDTIFDDFYQATIQLGMSKDEFFKVCDQTHSWASDVSNMKRNDGEIISGNVYYIEKGNCWAIFNGEDKLVSFDTEGSLWLSTQGVRRGMTPKDVLGILGEPAIALNTDLKKLTIEDIENGETVELIDYLFDSQGNKVYETKDAESELTLWFRDDGGGSGGVLTVRTIAISDVDYITPIQEDTVQ